MQQRLMGLYRKLETKYGQQGWWPAKSPYEVMVGAVLTQNTNWWNVEKAIANLRKAKLLQPNRIMNTGNRKLQTLIRPSGFYRQKTERLKLATLKWLELRNTQHRALGTEHLRNSWLSVKGIGKETADSILLYAFDRRIFVIDAYTRRFCDHHGLFKLNLATHARAHAANAASSTARSRDSGDEVKFKGKEYDDYRDFFESNLPGDIQLYKEYHALIVMWGKSQARKVRRT